ncbi:MAG: hypothetical protein NT172_09315, partial [Planctomycetota bacterium]|nr:hypothetical protein [Planctomycetota bacterium]
AKLEQSMVAMPTEQEIEADFEGTLNELNALLESARNIAANAAKPAESEKPQTPIRTLLKNLKRNSAKNSKGGWSAF